MTHLVFLYSISQLFIRLLLPSRSPPSTRKYSRAECHFRRKIWHECLWLYNPPYPQLCECHSGSVRFECPYSESFSKCAFFRRAFCLRDSWMCGYYVEMEGYSFLQDNRQFGNMPLVFKAGVFCYFLDVLCLVCLLMSAL